MDAQIGRIEIEWWSVGNGIDGGAAWTRAFVTTTTCIADILRCESEIGGGAMGCRFSALGSAATPITDARVVELAEVPIGDQEAPSDGGTRLVASRRWEGDLGDAVMEPVMPDGAAFALGAAGFEIQPVFAGEPQMAPRCLRNLSPIAGERTAMLVNAVGQPVRSATFGSIEVWESPDLRHRNGGATITVYDQRTRTHRWVLDSGYVVVGTRFHWIGVADDLLLGETRSRHPAFTDFEGFVVIDLRRGTAHRLEIRDAWPQSPRFAYESEAGGIPLPGRPSFLVDGMLDVPRSRDGSVRIPTRALRAAVDGMGAGP